MSTVRTNNVQVGQSLTATNNFTLYQPTVPDGTVRLGVGNTGATTLDAVTVNSAGNVAVPSLTVNSNNISAVNSLGFRNRIINGDMRITQYFGTGSTTTGSNGYVIDRWLAQYGSGTLTFQQTTSVVPAGFAYAESVTVTSAGTRNAGDYFVFSQVIEGLNVSDLGFGAAGAVTVTLSFWVRSSVTGTYSGVLASGDNTRTYAFTYSIPSANTWTQISVTIAGDTSGGQTAYPINNTAGLRLKLDLGSGSNYQITAGSWQAAVNKIGTSSQVGWAQTAGATFYITGVQLEAGTVATPFERRDIGRELIMCQRYYQTGTMRFGGFATTAIGFQLNSTLPVVMRATPTITNSGQTNAGCSGSAVAAVDAATVQLTATTSSGPGYISGSNYAASIEL